MRTLRSKLLLWKKHLNAQAQALELYALLGDVHQKRDTHVYVYMCLLLFSMHTTQTMQQYALRVVFEKECKYIILVCSVHDKT